MCRLIAHPLAATLAVCPAIAFSHGAASATEDGGWLQWSLGPLLAVLLAATLFLYVFGLRRLLARTRRAQALHWKRATFFLLGWGAMVIALCSPLDSLGAALFSAHMLQHEILMIVAAPLLVLGRPLVTWTWALPGGWRRRLSGGIRHPAVHAPWQAITSPIGGWLAHAVTLWVWHVPLFFESALAHPWLHEMQHASFLAGALLFWWSVIGHITPKSTAYAVLSLFTTMVHTSVLGALLTLSPALWFTSYAETAPLAGADPLQDQQLGGLIMWVPGAVAYVIGALVSGARLIFSREIRSYVDIPISEMERRSQ